MNITIIIIIVIILILILIMNLAIIIITTNIAVSFCPRTLFGVSCWDNICMFLSSYLALCLFVYLLFCVSVCLSVYVFF